MSNKFLKRVTDCIFIMLGSACNLKCRYCLQQCQTLPQLPNKINKDIYEFIRERAEENGEAQLSLQFYGGEPAIYFEKIREVVENTKDIPNVVYSMISNGKAITEEMVRYFNEHEFFITISWDGEASTNSRKYDAFKENKDTLFKIDKLGVSGVISAVNYPLEWYETVDKLSREYESVHGTALNVNMDYIFDTGITDKELIEQLDYDKLYLQGQELAKNCIQVIENGMDATSISFRAIKKILNMLGGYYSNDTPRRKSVAYASCGNGYNVLNMDLGGNLYACHNIFESCGSIYSPYFRFLADIIDQDNSVLVGKNCNSCVAMAVCHGGCKLLSKEQKEKTGYCKIRKAFVGGIIEEVRKYGSERNSQ